MISWVKNKFPWLFPCKETSSLSIQLLREALSCQRQALKYDLKNPYLAGVYSGKAAMLNRWAAREREKKHE